MTPASSAERAPSEQRASARKTVRGETLLGWLLVLPSLCLAALALAGPITSSDLWWHLSMGEWILAHGELPATDPFSHTAGSEPCEIQEYGTQVLFALLERAGGIPLLRAAGAVLAASFVACVFLVARRRLPAAWAAASAALCAALFALKWELRPHLLSAFLLLTVSELCFPPAGSDRAPRPGPRRWALLFVVSLVWTQLHAEAVFAFVFAFAGVLGAMLALWTERAGGATRVRDALGLLAAAALGTLLSPSGIGQFTYAFVDSSIPRRHIDEWFRMWDTRFVPAPLFALVLVAAFAGASFVGACALARLARRSHEHEQAQTRISWERIGFLAVCVVMAILARRFFWLLWFPVTDALAHVLRRRGAHARALPALACIACALILAGTHFVADAVQSARGDRFARQVDTDLLPVFAADFVDGAGLAGNLYHRYEWGGYLGFRLWPRNRVFMDSRTVLFAKVIEERARIERWEALGGRAYAESRLDERDVRILVMPSLLDSGAGLTRWRPPGAHEVWIRAWVDSTAIVWIRADDRDGVARVRAWYAERGIDFDVERGVVEAAVLAVHPEWMRERNTLDRAVRARLEPLYGQTGDRAAGIERAQAYLEVRMRRSAAFELERAVALRSADDPETHAAWRALLADDRLEELIRLLGEAP